MAHTYSSLWITVKFSPLPHLIHFALNSDLTDTDMTTLAGFVLAFARVAFVLLSIVSLSERLCHPLLKVIDLPTLCYILEKK